MKSSFPYGWRMKPSIETTVHAVLQGRRLLTHPFYVRWENGELSLSELTHYAEQYRFFEAYLPEFLTELSGNLDEGTARDAVLANLSDEVTPPSHLNLFDQFAAAYGAQETEISPAMAALLDAYRSALSEGVAVAVAGLLAYEVQGAAIATSKSGGLSLHYGATSTALDFWMAHSSMEENHAHWTTDGLAALSPSDDDVVLGVRLVADAWWNFLSEREALAAA
jgi:pyrroloquinoline quinone (PQQ) biosynthesis protein C